MTWAQRLKRVFKMAVETCEICGGKMKVIAVIEEPAVIKRILAHLKNGPSARQHPEHPPHPPRAPPQLTPRRDHPCFDELCLLYFLYPRGTNLNGYRASRGSGLNGCDQSIRS